MSIVVVYDTAGSFDCGSSSIVLCIRYESTEAWLVHFEDKLREWHKCYSSSLSKLNEWDNKFTQWKNKFRKTLKTDKSEEYSQWLKERPHLPPFEFNFCGCEFSIEDFVVRDKGRYIDTFMLPDVYELKEWFDKHICN